MYTSFGIGFDQSSEFLLPDGSTEKNASIFGADMSTSVHIDNKKKDILIFPLSSTQRLDDTALTAEAKYPIDFTQSGKRFVLSLHYNGSYSFLFVNATKTYQFKAKYSETKKYPLCLGNISGNFSANNVKKKNSIKWVFVQFLC